MMVKSFLSQWVGLVVTGLISVILTPILVHGLGDLYYGMWILVASLLDYYGLLDLGIRYTLQRFVGRYSGMKDRVALNQTLATALAGMSGIGIFVCVLSFLLAAILPGFFSLAGPSRRIFQELLLLGGLGVAVVLPGRLLGSYLCGLNRFDLYNLAVVVTGVVRAVLFVLVLWRGYGVLGVAAANLGISLLALVLNLRLVRWADRGLSLSLRLASWARLRELGHFSVYVFLISVGDQLRFYTGSIVIARFLTVALTTPFNVVTRLIEYFKLAFYPITGPLVTAMSALEGKAQKKELQKLYLDSSKFTLLLSMLGCSLLFFHGKDVLRLWLGPSFVASYGLLVILLVGYLVAQTQLPSHSVLYARARHRALAFWTLGEGVANLGLSAYWATHTGVVRLLAGNLIPSGYYGLAGVALGTAVPMLFVRTIIEPWYVLGVVEIPAREYVAKVVARPLLAWVLFLAVCGRAQMPWMGKTLLHLAATVGLEALLFVLLAYALGLAPPERADLWQRVRHRLVSMRAATPAAAIGQGIELGPVVDVAEPGGSLGSPSAGSGEKP